MPKQQLIPPPELAPPTIRHLPLEKRIRLWAQMVDEGDQLLLDGFRQKCGSDEAARQAFLDWLDRQNIEKTAATFRMLSRCHVEQTDGK